MMERMPVTLAEKMFDYLVKHGGANESQRDEFMTYFCNLNPLNNWEFRCVHKLGFGGKLRWDGREAPYVTMYPEDSTPEREKLAWQLNGCLRMLFDHYAEGSHEQHS